MPVIPALQPQPHSKLGPTWDTTWETLPQTVAAAATTTITTTTTTTKLSLDSDLPVFEWRELGTQE